MTTIYDRIKKLLPEQYKDTANLNAILEVLASPFDDLKVVYNDLKNLLNLEDVEGAQLDLIGNLVGEKRNGREDAEYLIGIRFKIFKNTSKALVDDVVKALKFITQADLVVYSDNPPASYTIYTNGKTLASNINEMIDKLSAAGVSLIVYASDGEFPFIATEVSTTQDNLIDDSGKQFIDDGTNNIVIYRQVFADSLQIIFKGINFGVVQNLDLTNDTGETIITDTGAILGCYDATQAIIESGKANLAYQ